MIGDIYHMPDRRDDPNHASLEKKDFEHELLIFLLATKAKDIRSGIETLWENLKKTEKKHESD